LALSNRAVHDWGFHLDLVWWGHPLAWLFTRVVSPASLTSLLLLIADWGTDLLLINRVQLCLIEGSLQRWCVQLHSGICRCEHLDGDCLHGWWLLNLL
jgi:hypothetical protein